MVLHQTVPPFLIGWAIAALLAGGSVVWLMRRAGMRPRQIGTAFLALFAALVVGSKLLYLAEAWPWWTTSGIALRDAVLSPRLRIPGGFILAVLIGPPLARALRVPYLRFADTVIPAAGLLIVGIRVGCFLEGCCYGMPSSVPWAVTFRPLTEVYLWQVTHGLIPMGARASLPVHPLQLYFGLAGFLIFAGLSWYRPHRRYDGELLVLFGLSYLWSTWLLEFMRAQPHVFTQQLVFAGALAMAALAAVIEWRRRAVRRVPASLAGEPGIRTS